MLSRPENLTPLVELIQGARPATIADVGAGWGKLGLIAREALTAVAAETGDDPSPDPWEVVFLEAWEGGEYFTTGKPGSILDAVYDRVVPGWATVARHPHGFDLVLLVDVLEHIPKDEGGALLAVLIGANRAVLVSTPRVVTFYDRHFYGVPEHVCQWELAELKAYAPGAVRDASTEASHILLYAGSA